jgi:hypothetical protein
MHSKGIRSRCRFPRAVSSVLIQLKEYVRGDVAVAMEHTYDLAFVLQTCIRSRDRVSQHNESQSTHFPPMSYQTRLPFPSPILKKSESAP